MSGQFHVPAAFLLGYQSPIPIVRKLGGSQSRFGSGGEEKIPSLPLPGIERRSYSLYTSHYPDWATKELGTISCIIRQQTTPLTSITLLVITN